MADFSATTFLDKMVSGGALQSLFEATVNVPAGVTAPGDFNFMCKTTSFPISTVEVTPVSYMGRSINIPGNREVQQWTTECYNDESHQIRSALLGWMNFLNDYETNARKETWTTTDKYTGTLTVSQFTKSAGSATNTVTFYDAWPSSIGEISLDWETSEIQTFEVTWEFSYWNQSATGLAKKAEKKTPAPKT